MTVNASRFASVFGEGSFTATKILLQADGLEVERIYTTADPTEMIKGQAVGNRTDE